MSLNQLLSSDFSEYYRWSQRTKIKYKLHYGGSGSWKWLNLSSVDDFNTWCIDNNMGVHYGKTHAFVVSSKHMTSSNECISITINEHTIVLVSAQKHLGITIDKNLTWEQQIDLVCRNISRVNLHLWSYYQNTSTKIL